MEYYVSENPTEAINRSKERLYRNVLKEAEIRLGGSPGRLLDVGCGDGHFLRLARKRGWKPYGVEPVQELVREARKDGLDVSKGVLADLLQDGGVFDLITYWDVLMLVDHPLHEVQEALGRLSERGFLYLRVRNHAVLRLVDRLWVLIGPFLPAKNPAVYHPYNFSPRTMREICRRANLTCSITGGRLTEGDAYSVSGSRRVAELGKRFVGRFAYGLEHISDGRVIASPTLDVWGQRRPYFEQ